MIGNVNGEICVVEKNKIYENLREEEKNYFRLEGEHEDTILDIEIMNEDSFVSCDYAKKVLLWNWKNKEMLREILPFDHTMYLNII